MFIKVIKKYYLGKSSINFQFVLFANVKYIKIIHNIQNINNIYDFKINK